MNHINIIGKVERITTVQDDFIEALILTRDRHSATQKVDRVLHPCKFTDKSHNTLDREMVEEGTELAIEGSMINEDGQYKILVNNLIII